MTRNQRLHIIVTSKIIWDYMKRSLLLFITCSLRIMGSQVTDGLEIQKTPAIQTTAKPLQICRASYYFDFRGSPPEAAPPKIGHHGFCHGISLPLPARVQALQGRCPQSLGRLAIPGEGSVTTTVREILLKNLGHRNDDFDPST